MMAYRHHFAFATLSSQPLIHDGCGHDHCTTLGNFIAEACHLGSEEQVSKRDLYEHYTSWCEQNGEAAFKQPTFSKRLRERGGGLRDDRGTRGRRFWRGIGMSDASDAATLSYR